MSDTSAAKIMVVDDEADILHIVLSYLRAWKFDVQGFTSPDEALKAFHENPSSYSLVLTDLRMPGMTGFELARSILQIRADIKIVLMTAFEIDNLELELGLPRITYKEIIQKPFRLKQVCDAVRKQLQVAN